MTLKKVFIIYLKNMWPDELKPTNRSQRRHPNKIYWDYGTSKYRLCRSLRKKK